MVVGPARLRATVVGERGILKVVNFVAPQMFTGSRSTVEGRRRREKFHGETTYAHQLRAFAAAVRGEPAAVSGEPAAVSGEPAAVHGEPANLTPPADSVATMTLIDEIYRAAGLPIRQ